MRFEHQFRAAEINKEIHNAAFASTATGSGATAAIASCVSERGFGQEQDGLCSVLFATSKA
jgi:hypothetical protein